MIELPSEINGNNVESGAAKAKDLREAVRKTLSGTATPDGFSAEQFTILGAQSALTPNPADVIQAFAEVAPNIVLPNFDLSAVGDKAQTTLEALHASVLAIIGQLQHEVSRFRLSREVGNRLSILLLTLLISACSLPPDPRPTAIPTSSVEVGVTDRVSPSEANSSEDSSEPSEPIPTPTSNAPTVEAASGDPQVQPEAVAGDETQASSAAEPQAVTEGESTVQSGDEAPISEAPLTTPESDPTVIAPQPEVAEGVFVGGTGGPDKPISGNSETLDPEVSEALISKDELRIIGNLTLISPENAIGSEEFPSNTIFFRASGGTTVAISEGVVTGVKMPGIDSEWIRNQASSTPIVVISDGNKYAWNTERIGTVNPQLTQEFYNKLRERYPVSDEAFDYLKELCEKQDFVKAAAFILSDGNIVNTENLMATLSTKTVTIVTGWTPDPMAGDYIVSKTFGGDADVYIVDNNVIIFTGLFRTLEPKEIIDYSSENFDPFTITIASENGGDVKSNPDAQSSIVYSANNGDTFPILGISADKDWYLVVLSDGTRGWISSQDAVFTGDFSKIPELTNEGKFPYQQFDETSVQGQLLNQLLSAVNGGERPNLNKSQANLLTTVVYLSTFNISSGFPGEVVPPIIPN